jgi:hypothetical protein
MSEPDFSELFTKWKGHRTTKTLPHTVCTDPTRRIVTIVQRRGRRPDGDWALRDDLVKNTDAAVRDGRLDQAFVVQAEGLKALRWENVATVVANIGDATPLDGYLGHPFHWLDEHFQVVNGRGGWSAEEPF